MNVCSMTFASRRSAIYSARSPPRRVTLWQLTTHKILEDDNIFLHAQGHTYRAGSSAKLAPGWQRRLHMPITSDAMVIAFHRWLDKFTSGGGAPWSPQMVQTAGTPANVLPRRSSREEVLERYDSHVAH